MKGFEIEVSGERRRFLEGFKPLVRFELPSDKRGFDYHRYVVELIAEFVLWADPRNKGDSEMVRYHNTWNEEGGIFLVVDNHPVRSKMYFFDGGRESESPLSNYEPWKGVMFRDHAERDIMFVNTVNVFLISDAFEKFLQEKGFAFTRHNQSR
jgi:hypothetical protein